MSFRPNDVDGADDGYRAWALEMALIRHRCPWCGRSLRPCNLGRHIAKAHFRQLTVDDVIADLKRETAT